MTEREWWSKYVKSAWHQPSRNLLALKVEDKFKSGVPDVDLCLRGIGAKCELKYVKSKDIPSAQQAHSLLSAAQRVMLHQWCKAGGIAWVAVGHDLSRTVNIWDAVEVLTEQEGMPLIQAHFGKRPAADWQTVPLEQVPDLMYNMAHQKLLSKPLWKPLVTHQDIKNTV